MAVRSKGLRSKSRQILRRKPREKGMPPVTHALREFPVGTRVAIKINPAIHGGMPHVRFQGAGGKVMGRQGEAFRIQVIVGKKPKELVVRPEHLRALA